MKAMKKLGALVLSLALALVLVVVPGGNAKAASTVRIWFDNGAGWDTVITKAWGSDDPWPEITTNADDYGQDVTANVEDGWYYVDLDNSINFGILFDCGDWGDGNQTGDVTVEAGTTECWITYDGTDTDIVTTQPDGAPSIGGDEDDGDGDEPTPEGDEPTPDTHYVYFDNGAGWDSVYVYVANSDWSTVFSADWPGDEVTTTEDGWYYVDLDNYDGDVYYVIFSNNGDSDTQTGNIILNGNSDNYWVQYASYPNDGTEREALNEKPSEGTTPTPTADTLPIAGIVVALLGCGVIAFAAKKKSAR